MPRLLGLSVVLWSVVFFALCVSSGRKPIAGDSAQMCRAAESLLTRGEFSVEPTRSDVTRGPDGKFYVKYPLLTVLQCVPAIMLRDRVDRASYGDLSLVLLAPQLVPHAITATLALGAMHLALELGVAAAGSVVFALLITFTTPIWVAARSLYSELLQATLTMWFAFAMLRARDSKHLAAWALLGLLGGMAINTKITLCVLPLALLVDQLYERWDRQRWIAAACALPGALLGAAAFLWYNQTRYGDALSQGYESLRDGELGFSVPLASGVYGLLFSSGKSVFQYAPLLLASAWAVPYWYRERRRELWIVAIPSVITLCVIAKWWAWSGDWGWGPRLLLPVIPLACVPVLRWFTAPSRVAVAWVSACAAVGLYVQALGLSVDPSQYIHMVRHPARIALGKYPDEPHIRDPLLIAHFIPEFNPIVSQQWLVWRHFHPTPVNEDSWHPWQTLGIRYWRPKSIPTPETLNFWIAGKPRLGAMLWYAAFALLAFGLSVTLVWQLRREGRAERLRARTAQALDAPSS